MLHGRLSKPSRGNSARVGLFGKNCRGNARASGRWRLAPDAFYADIVSSGAKRGAVQRSLDSIFFSLPSNIACMGT